MPLNAAGKLTLKDMATEFGVAAGTTILLSKFRTGGEYGVSQYSGSNLPGAGQATSMSKFRGAFKLVAPSIATIPTLSGSSASANAAFNIGTYVTATYTGPVTYSLTNAPAGVTINSSTGNITVASGTTVNQSVTLVVTGQAGSASRSFTLSVAGTSVGTLSGFTMSIPTVNANPFYVDTGNRTNISNSGRQMYFVTQSPSGIYNDANGPYVAIMDTITGLYLRHSSSVLRLDPFSQNTLDFAWKFIYDNASGNYQVYNPYLSGYYMGYNGTNVAIQTTFTYPVRVTGSLTSLGTTSHPAGTVTSGAQTATFNGLTYTFSNQGCNAQYSAYLFDRDVSLITFFDGLGAYNTSTGAYGGTAATTNGVSGAFFQMQVSSAITIQGYVLAQFNRYCVQWSLFGSNNGSTWTELDSQSYASWTYGNASLTYAISPATYTYFRMVIRKSAQGENAPCWREFRFIS